MCGKMGDEELGNQNLGLILKQNKQANRKHDIAEARSVHSNWEEGGNLLLPLKVAGALSLALSIESSRKVRQGRQLSGDG